MNGTKNGEITDDHSY